MKIILTPEERALLTAFERLEVPDRDRASEEALRQILPTIDLDDLREFWESPAAVLSALLAHAEPDAP